MRAIVSNIEEEKKEGIFIRTRDIEISIKKYLC